MSVLKNKIIRFGFRWLPIVSLYEICGRIHSSLHTYRLPVRETEVCFSPRRSPGINTAVQKLDREQSGNVIPELKTAIINFPKNRRICNS